ncbi:MAG: hypothetical protein ACHP9Y_06030 [Gammaproteobacteria bacterium]
MTLREAGVERLLNRRVLTWFSKGSYGTGGTGFFALRLAAQNDYPKEWLILTLWGSADWLLLDGAELRVQYSTPKLHCVSLLNWAGRKLGKTSYYTLFPLIVMCQYASFLLRPFYDSSWRKIKGSEISKVVISEDSSSISLQKGKITHTLEIPQIGPALPSGEKWVIKANHLDAGVLSKSGKIYC